MYKIHPLCTDFHPLAHILLCFNPSSHPSLYHAHTMTQTNSASHTSTPAFTQTNFLSLPTDLHLSIFQFCPIVTLQALFCSCRLFHDALEMRSWFWERYCGGMVIGRRRRVEREDARIERIGEEGGENTSVDAHSTIHNYDEEQDICITTRQEYTAFLNLQRNYLNGRIQTRMFYHAHNEAVNHLYATHDTIISTSFDHDIKIWADRGERLVQTIDVHSAPVLKARWSRQHVVGEGREFCANDTSNELLVSLDWNSVIAVHKRSEETGTFRTLSTMQLEGEHALKSAGQLFNCGRNIICATNDPSLQLLDLEHMECVTRFTDHHESTISWVEQIDDCIFATCSRDRCVCIFDVRERKPVKKITDYPCGVYKMTHDPLSGNLFVGGYNGIIWKIDMSIMSKGQALHGHSGRIQFLKIQEGILVSGSKDLSVRLWDTKHGFQQNVFDGFKGFPMDCDVNQHRLAVVSYDQTLTVLHNGFQDPNSSNGLPIDITTNMYRGWVTPAHWLEVKSFSDCAITMCNVMAEDATSEDMYVGLADGNIHRVTFGANVDGSDDYDQSSSGEDQDD